MKRLLLSLCVVALLVSAAAAQEENPYKGFYIGFYAGGVGGDADTTMSTVDTGTYFASASVTQINTAGLMNVSGAGFAGGGQAGYNYQNGAFLLGFEVDFGAMHTEDTSTTGPIEYTCCAGTFFTLTQTAGTDWLITARPRVGVVSGNWLTYFTAGLAVTNLEYVGTFTDTFDGATESARMDENRLGWTIGGGIEYRFGGGPWSLKGEYLYSDFGDESVVSTNLTTTTFGAFPDTPFTHTVDLRTHSGRIGINYRF